MASILLRNGRRIGDFQDPYIVAELNTSHFGDLDLARAMIRTAREVGCDCVKFQSWTADSLYAKAHYQGNAIARRMVDKFSLGDDKLTELADFCQSIGIDFASTPYSYAEAQFLVESCAVPFVKIASMELNNLPYLSRLGHLGAPLVLSTGMGTLEEIIRAVKTIEATGNRQIAILHCVSNYPAPLSSTRLNNILGLRSEFPEYPIGYSDHTIGGEVAIASVALGAALIEKHFTLDSSRIGMDNQMATEPIAMKEMISGCHHVYQAMGASGRLLDDAERAQIPKMRRSLVASRALKAGTRLAPDDLDAKRPGNGIAPDQWNSVVGRILLIDLDPDDQVLPEHLAPV